MNTKTWTTALTALALLWAANASALTYCDTKNPCKLATDVCHGGVCVPQAKLCKSTTSCNAWQKCDFTCPGGGTTSADPMPKPGYADASSGGAAPMPAYDGGAGIAMPPDAGEAPPPWDAGSEDASPYIAPNCPADVGVCVVDTSKVATMPGCLDFCTGLVTCNLVSGGSGSGSTGSGGGGAPSPIPGPGPGGNGDSAPGFAPKPPDCDGCSSDKAIPMPIDAGESDSGPIGDTTSTSGDLNQCVLVCSVMILESVAHKELVAAEQCVAAYPTSCSDMASQCTTKFQQWGEAAMADDSWTLGFFPGSVVTPGVPVSADGGSAGSADASSTSGGVDGGSVFGDGFVALDALFGSDGGGPKGADGTASGSAADAGSTNGGADTGAKGDGGSAAVSLPYASSGSAASACTASSAAPASPWSLAGLGLLCLAVFGLRRRASSTR